MIDKKQFLAILKRKHEGTISAEETRFLETYYNLFESEPDIIESLSINDQEILKAKIETSLSNELEQVEAVRIKRRNRILLYKWAAAAVVLIVSGVFVFKRVHDLKPSATLASIQQKVDFKPGSNNAKLTLADGSVVILDTTKQGAIASENGIEVTKAKDGQLVYTIKGNASSSAVSIAYNTIETPKGGQYQVVLPEGSKVWLNAASKIKFPLSFENLKNRKVELSGEAYFEVTKDKMKPFIVLSALQAVQVYGTHFNVSAYADDKQTRTTLLEGSVKVVPASSFDETKYVNTAEVFIRPGEQAANGDNKIRISKVDTEQAVAWKNGYFMFDEENLEAIMQRVSRWYNVEVVYQESALRDLQFSGSVSRFENASQLLKVIELTGLVHFKTEGRRIVVMK